MIQMLTTQYSTLFLLDCAVMIVFWIYFRNQNLTNSPLKEYEEDTCQMWCGVETHFNLTAVECWDPSSKFTTLNI